MIDADGSNQHTVAGAESSVLFADWQPVATSKPPFNGNLVFMSLGNSTSAVYTVRPDGMERTTTSPSGSR